MVEERLETHPALAPLRDDGVPDIRVIVYRGVPVMCMMRLPTRLSDGRANLHQGAVGIGIDLVQRPRHPCHAARAPHRRRAPTPASPWWAAAARSSTSILRTAVAATDQTGLGYVGADVVLDARLGPVILELNARPGLAIQLANRAGSAAAARRRGCAARTEGGAGSGARRSTERIELGRSIAARLSR